MRACTSCRSRCRSSTTTAARSSRTSTPRARSRPTCRRAWKRSRRCRKRSAPTASCSPGSPSTASMACRACGAASTSSRAGKTRWKRRCASAWVRWKSRAWTWCAPSPTTRRHAKLAFYSPRSAVRRKAGALPRLVDLLRLNDAGQQALLTDWLHGCYTATTLEEALAAREQAAAGRSHLRAERPCGHRAQRELLRAGFRAGRPAGPPAGNREPGKQLRAQTLIAEEARSALVRAEAAYGDAAQRLTTARREAAEHPVRAHELQVETLRLTQLAEQTRARSEQIASDLGEVDALLEELQERASPPKAASRNSTCSWPTARSATPSWTNA
jgi:hypothetical protein